LILNAFPPVAAAQAPATYDRILSIEMFEHMKVGAGGMLLVALPQQAV
jgi:cyclopropane fatty-acyl-phospholipid synthase-like methyltransferase